MYLFTTVPHAHGHWQLHELLGNRYINRYDDDVSVYNSTASTWTLATPRTTWESIDISFVYHAGIC